MQETLPYILTVRRCTVPSLDNCLKDMTFYFEAFASVRISLDIANQLPTVTGGNCYMCYVLFEHVLAHDEDLVMRLYIIQHMGGIHSNM